MNTGAAFTVAGNTVTRLDSPTGHFAGLTHQATEFLTLYGSFAGADTFNVRPLASTTVILRGFNPTAAIGDTLNLGFAGVTNPVFTPGATGAGGYTFANAAPVNYDGIETKAIDSVAPTVLNASFQYDLPRQELRFQFSEDVSTSISTGSLSLTNTTTGQVIPTAQLAVSYDVVVNTARFTYQGNAAGILPDGNYHAVLAAGIQDRSGNATTTPTMLDFFVLGGDADHDRDIDVNDLGILASNWQQSPRTFSRGDFDYSGTVDINDLGILATGWQHQLAAPNAPLARVSSESRATTRIAADVL
jgi:hypothetical protein